MWQKLVENSLIGTAKLKLQKEELPAFLNEFLENSVFTDEESLFLQATSFANLYLESGALPPTFEGVIDDSKFEETKAFAPKKFSKILAYILDSSIYLPKEYLLQLWLNKLIVKSWVVDSSNINTILEFGNKLSNKSKLSIYEAVGKKGQWLLALRKDLNYQVSEDSHIWDEGDNAQRKVLFEELRKSEPLKAMEFLEKTWKTESITTKRAFLEIMDSTLQETDYSFLDNLWKYEFLPKANEKETEKTCRALVVKMLLKFEKSEMFQIFENGITPYFQKKKKSGLMGFVTGKAEIILDLPVEEDHFWSKTNILNIFGINSNPSQSAIFSALSIYWLSEIMSLVPFGFWERKLEKNTTEALNYLLKDEQFKVVLEGKKYSILLSSIIQNAVNTKNQTLIASLLPMVDKDDALPLVGAVSSELFEQYVSKNNLWIDAQVFAQRAHVEEKWSLRFSEKMVVKIYEDATKNNVYLPENITKICAKSLHIGAFQFLGKADVDINNYQAKHYQRVFYEPLSQFKEIMSNIEKYA